MDHFAGRVRLFERAIGARSIDSFLVTSETNVSYLTGFSGKDSVALLTPKERYLITDSRYIEEAEEEARGFKVLLAEKSLYETIGAVLKNDRPKRLGFESMNLEFEAASRLRRFLGRTKPVPVKNLVEGLRSIKDSAEIAAIRDAARLTKKVFTAIAGYVKPGATEKRLSDRIEIEFIKRGGRAGFQPIVAYGKHASKPHARPENMVLHDNSFVMIDMGCSFRHYHADLTRMVILGKVKARFKKICAIVAEAQNKAIAAIRPGVKISEVDVAGRAHITAKGFGKYFGHSLGHGIGMEVHEEPTVSRYNNDALKAGMIFTVEPAIYIPGFGGVRIEDMVLVTDDGCEVLTS